jgi:hypothetical protein
MARHFPHRSPRFGTQHNPKPSYHWEDTFYYWWWRYLKHNQDYLKTCASDGNGPCASLYEDFGDVRPDDFKAWWIKDWRGARLFAEPALPEKERILHPGDPIPPPEEAFSVCFPLSLSKEFMERSFKQMLKKLEYHQGRVGFQDSKRSRAKYQVQGNSTVPSLRKGVLIYELHLESPELKLWEIGNCIAGVCDDQKITVKGSGLSADVDAKKILAAAVSRYLKKTKRSIERTGQGMFP